MTTTDCRGSQTQTHGPDGSSFVVNECAMKSSARRVKFSIKNSVGAAASSAASTASTAASTMAASTAASHSRRVSFPPANMVVRAKGRRPSFSKGAADPAVAMANDIEFQRAPPDSRGSSLSSCSPSPRPHARNIPPITEKNDDEEHPSGGKKCSITDIILEEPESPESDSISRRLVEYFVMVSCVPIVECVIPGNNARLTKKRSLIVGGRAPDPSRDNMNSRTRGRFEVRAVHLPINSGSDDSENESDDKQQNLGQAAEGDVKNTLLEPTITARYPAVDHPDQQLNLRLPQFCHPEGTDLIHPTTTYKMPRIHHFVLTDSMGGKQYGTALTVMEEFKGTAKQQEDTAGKKQTYYAPRVLVLLSTWPYLTAFRTYLTQLYRLATTTDIMTAPIERYVQNICSEVPAPPPGAFEVQLNILGSDIRFWAPPANQPIPYVSLPFKALFECLDIGNVLFAWYTLACEQKVLLVSSQLSLLTVCSEILCSLLFPMKWSHLYIPVLPRSLSPMLDAPMPYLCGISRENFPYACEDISDETAVVDLDRNVITLGPNTPELPSLPFTRRRKLETALKVNAGEVFWEARNLTKEDVLKARASGDEGALTAMLDGAGGVWEEKIRTRDSAFNLAHAPGSVSLELDEDANISSDAKSLTKQSRWDSVQEAFLLFYVALLQDYRKFLPQDADLGKRSDWRGKEGLSDLRFQKDEFVAAANAEFQPFLWELAMTQQFDDFVTRKMHNAADAPDIKFFDQSIDAKRNRSKLILKKKETQFLHAASAHRYLKRVQAVEPNREGLPSSGSGEGVYMYDMWPLTFDESLFGTLRPIPSIISAEFDRMTALRSMLRSNSGIGDESCGMGGRNQSPEVTAFILFFMTFTSVIGKELSSVEQKQELLSVGQKQEVPSIEQKQGTTGDELKREFGHPSVPLLGQNSRRSLIDLDDDIEVARTIAHVQIDMGYHTLLLMRLRRLPPEPIVYKFLIQACGRTKTTHRASALMAMLARDGLATNPEIYTSLIKAFSTDDDGHQRLSLAFYQMYGSDNLSTLSYANKDTSSNRQSLLERHTNSSVASERSMETLESVPGELTNSMMKTKDRMKNAMASRLKKPSLKSSKPMKSKGKHMISSKLSPKKHILSLTPAIANQIELGESILETLYPSTDIDIENVCPKCATVLNENDIGTGWTPCASNDYQTKCTSCQHKFVPKFSVACKSPSFEGSQGRGTPLYCDHLSPWVLLSEIRSIIAATGGVDSIIDEKFRKGPDISATLWWNMIVTFRRYKLPYIFLLQGSFQNQLIQPSLGMD